MKLVLTIILCWSFSLLLFAQNESSYEKWQKQKQMEYQRWKKERVGQSAFPMTPEQKRISSFIDAGFNNTDDSNLPGNVTVTPTQMPTPPTNNIASIQESKIKVWAVIVGVAAYNDIQSLKYTDDDAYKVYAFFKSPEGGGLPDNQVKVLIDEDATRENIFNAMKMTYSNAKKEDVIIFYFSGHGAEGALITHEFDSKRQGSDRKGLILHEELNAIFEKNPARYKYIIADACHAGSSVGKGIKNGASEALDNYYQALEQSKGGLVMMLSCMGNEVSIETGGIRQGIFSYNFIQGLIGKADTDQNKIITVVELFDYIDANVKKYTNFTQNPVIFGNYDTKMPIAIIRTN